MDGSSKSHAILITGATAGIGLHAAIHFARSGWHVIATGRDPAKLAALHARVAAGSEAARPRLQTLRLDVNDPASIQAAVAESRRLTGGRGVGVLVNNAGFATLSPLAEMPDSELRAQFETNLFGLMAVTRAFLPGMRELGWGRIINLSSSGGRISLPFVGAYHGAKFALEAMSDALRWELAPFGIRVVLIEPGPIRSEFADRMLESAARLRPDSAYAPLLGDLGWVRRLAWSNMREPEIVVRAIERAIVSRRPRARYLMPRHLGWIIAAFNALPDWLGDRVMCRLAGLTRRRLGLS